VKGHEPKGSTPDCSHCIILYRIMPLIDPYNRQIDYLRVSITDRCNLRCIYCMPASGVRWLPREEILKYEEIVRLVRVAVTAGIRKVRISGGEPLLRRNLAEFVVELAAIEGLEDLSLTTNGLFLPDLALPLKRAGLQRVNVSLDSLKPGRYRRITLGGELNKVWQGLEAAQAAGLEPLKLNVVVLAGINEDELLDFVSLAERHPWQVRFIELRPGSPLYPQAYLPISEVWQRINHQYQLQAFSSPPSTAARLYSFAGAKGSLGFIGKAEECLCKTCNRLRLTAAGQLYPCLFSPECLEVKPLLRRGAGNEELLSLLQLAVSRKPAQMPLSVSPLLLSNPMFKIGG